jgi:hypothetical protein
MLQDYMASASARGMLVAPTAKRRGPKVCLLVGGFKHDLFELFLAVLGRVLASE